MAATAHTTTPEPLQGTVETPDTTTCDMWGGRCVRPATFIVEATVRIGAHLEPLTWLVCDSLVCLAASSCHAEGIGGHVGNRKLTAGKAEEITSSLVVTS